MKSFHFIGKLISYSVFTYTLICVMFAVVCRTRTIKTNVHSACDLCQFFVIIVDISHSREFVSSFHCIWLMISRFWFCFFQEILRRVNFSFIFNNSNNTICNGHRLRSNLNSLHGKVLLIRKVVSKCVRWGCEWVREWGGMACLEILFYLFMYFCLN